MRARLAAAGLLGLPFLVFACSSGGDLQDAPFTSVRDPAPAPVPGPGVDTSTATNTNTNVDPTPSSGGSGTTTSVEIVCTPACSDDPPPNQDPTCSDWAEWGVCGQEWFDGYCLRSCGQCSGTEEVCKEVVVNNGGGGTGGTGGTGSTGGSSTGGGSGETAPDLPAGAQSGWASRYWDCCKPHCAWTANSPGGAMKMCSISNQPLSDPDAQSGCDGGPAYTCWNMAPWAVSDSLAYGFAATPAGGNDCGKCYQLEFTGTGEHNANDPGSKSLAGKTMIVQATNVGGDVGGGQFDLLIPGGGVGAFNGCSTQWGVSDLGAQYGGFLTACDGDVSCLRQRCNSVFADKPDLLDGCLFHADWMGGADNPQLRYAEVDCPAALEQLSGMSR